MSIVQSAMITVDLQAVISTMGSDMLMFVTAMVSFAVLHHVKTKSAGCKITCKESVAADSDCISHVQIPPKICTVEKNSPQLKCQPTEHQPKPRQPNPLKHCPAPPEQCRIDKNEPFNVCSHIHLMEKFMAERNIKDTLGMFRLIKQSGATLTSHMYNIVLKAWIKCGNVWAAEDLMEEMKVAGMADEESYLTIIKALLMIRDLEKTKGVLKHMSEAGVAPGAAALEEIIHGFARGGLFKDGITVLNEMYAAGVQPSGFTLNCIAELLNSARRINETCADMRQTLVKYGLQPKDMLITDPSELPRLVSVIFQADFFGRTAAYVHSVEIKGSLLDLEAVRKTLWNNGCRDHRCGPAVACNPDHQWQIEDSLDVIIDGEQTNLLTPSMSKTLRDAAQDKAYQSQASVVLNSVSKNGLCLPSCVENILTRYLGNDLYYIHMQFESQTPRADVFHAISCRHPRVGIRHCWATATMGSCGQRTLVNGDETDEACFNRHLSALHSAQSIS